MKKMTQQMAKDIIITAVEGGIGYWSKVENYHPSAGNVIIHEADAEANEFIIVSSTTLTYKMIQEKAEEFRQYANSSLRDRIGDVSWADWDYDSDDADYFVQFILFGELRYS